MPTEHEHTETVRALDYFTELAEEILTRARDYTDPEHVHACGSMHGDVVCEEPLCWCECGARIDIDDTRHCGDPLRYAWLAPDGTRTPYPSNAEQLTEAERHVGLL